MRRLRFLPRRRESATTAVPVVPMTTAGVRVVTVVATEQHLQEAGITVASRVTFCATHDRPFVHDDDHLCVAADIHRGGSEYHWEGWVDCEPGPRYALVLIEAGE